MNELLNKTIESYEDWYSIRDALMAAKKEFPEHGRDIQAMSNAIENYIRIVSQLAMNLKRKRSPGLDVRIKENLDKANDLLKAFQQHYMILLLTKDK